MGVFRRPPTRPYKRKPWIGTLPPAGNNVIRTATDALGLSDTVSRVGTFLRSISDALSLSESVDRLVTFLRNATDDLSLSDAVTRLATLFRTSTDAISFAEVVTGIRVILRSATDALGLSDTATRIGTFIRTTEDSLSLSDAVVRVSSFIRTTTDSLSLADVAAGIKIILRTATDTLSLSDAATRTGTFLRTVSDSLTLTDAVTRIITVIRTTVDSVSFSDTVVALEGIFRDAIDSLGLADVGERIIFSGAAPTPGITSGRTSRRRVTGINIETVRRHVPMSDFAKTRTKLDQRRFDDTAWGLEGFGDSLGDLSGNNGPVPDLGDIEVVIPATCDSPEYIVILQSPDDPNPTTDSYPENQTIYEELERVGDEFDPTFSVKFYRAVWFDGLEAYDPTHYDVGPTGNVIPHTVLIQGTVVTAQYVKAD